MPTRRSTGALLLGLALLVCGCEDRERSASAGPRAAAAERLDTTLAARLPPGASIESAEEGRALFPTCGVCHGMDGAGTQLGPSLRDAEWIHIAGEIPEIERIIREGVAEPRDFPIPMPVQGAGSFGDAEIRALATYVYLLGHGAR